MIICKQCGHGNQEQDSFCTSCGAFLEWREPVAAPPVPQRPGPYPAAQPPGSYPAPQPYTPPTAAPFAPPAAGQPQAVLPQAVRPAPQFQRSEPRPVMPAGPPAAGGDLVCPSCGAGNEPNRHFCRRCGSALGRPAPAEPAGWQMAAGERPAGMRQGATGGGLWSGVRSFLVAMLAAVVLGSGLAFAVLPGFRAAVAERTNAVATAIRRQVNPTYVPTRPFQARASSSVPGHGPQLTIDLVNNDYWAADTASDRQPVLTLSFATPTDLDYVIVTTGAGPDYANLARPRDVRITYSDGTTQDLTLKDDPKATGYTLSARQVTSASIRILTVYPSSRGTDVAIAELEFFRLS